MRESGLESYNHLAEIPTPTAYVTLAWTHRSAASLPGLRAFKNLTELDLAGNKLSDPLPDLHHLRYLRKLSISSNSLISLWSFPVSLEHLNLAHNRLTALAPLQSLQHLHTLDVSFNEIKTLDMGGSMPALKCLYAAHNRISSLEDIGRLPALTELDLSDNSLHSKADLTALQWSCVAAVKITGNPEALQLIAFDSVQWEFSHLEEGLFIRNVEKLKTLRSSRFHKLIKDKRKSAVKVRSSPDWGHAKASSRVSSEEVEDSHKVSSDPISLESQRLTLIPRKSDLSRGSLRLPLSDLMAEVQDQSCMFSCKLEETFHQNDEESLHLVFQDLVAYFRLDQCEEDFSFSAEKYERVAGVIKQREDERLRLVQNCGELEGRVKELEKALVGQERILMRLGDAESQLAHKSHTQLSLSKLRKENATLTQRLEATGRIKDTLEGLQEANVKLRTLFEDEHHRADEKAQEVARLAAQQVQYWDEIQHLRSDNGSLRSELVEESKGLMVMCMQAKIRELEEANENLKSGKLNTSFDGSELQEKSRLNISAMDCSYYRKADDAGSVLINKRVGVYVEQLKSKISKLQHKVHVLRDQRNKSNAQLQTWAKMLAGLQQQHRV